MKVSVVIPTWRRPDHLAKCLAGLAAQTRPPDEIVVVARADDGETWRVFEEHAGDEGGPAARGVTVQAPGLIQSLNTGLDAARGEIIAFTDDDAVPRPEWLERMRRHFEADPCVGGVGGRDWLYEGSRLIDGRQATVGRVRWYGRVIGNHHWGAGGPRKVDVLKGVNMAFRRNAVQDIRIDEELRGAPTQVHSELDLCLALKGAGWKLVYDPDVAVDHYPGPRFDVGRPESRSLLALGDEVFNEVYVLLKWLPLWRGGFAVAYALIVGTRQAPGLVTAIEARLRGGRPQEQLAVSTRARLDAVRAGLRDGRRRAGRR
jgi:GT2 family glycosyltransferase